MAFRCFSSLPRWEFLRLCLQRNDPFPLPTTVAVASSQRHKPGEWLPAVSLPPFSFPELDAGIQLGNKDGLRWAGIHYFGGYFVMLPLGQLAATCAATCLLTHTHITTPLSCASMRTTLQGRVVDLEDSPPAVTRRVVDWRTLPR